MDDMLSTNPPMRRRALLVGYPNDPRQRALIRTFLEAHAKDTIPRVQLAMDKVNGCWCALACVYADTDIELLLCEPAIDWRHCDYVIIDIGRLLLLCGG